MLKQILKKIKNKKWLSFCLVLGLTFLVATLSCHPMFKAGSLDKLIGRIFLQYIEGENQFPTVIGKSDYVMAEEFPSVAALMEEIDRYNSKWSKRIQLPVLEEQLFFHLPNKLTKCTYNEKGYSYNVAYMPALSEHTTIAFGEGYDTYQGDAIPCVMSEYVMDKCQLVVGEEIEFEDWKNDKGEKLKLVVAGVFKEQALDDIFWQIQTDEIVSHIFVSQEDFEYILQEYVDDFVFFTYYQVLDYRAITHRNVEQVAGAVRALSSSEKEFVETLTPFIEEYRDGKKTVDITLWVLELPILGMVLAYIYMVSSQIIETEKNEIAMIKSRGGSRLQVIWMYMVQSVFLALGGLVLGLPLGYLLCKIGAGTEDFLSFSSAGLNMYQPVWEMLIYGLIAVACGTVFLLIPVIASAGVSIVQRKSAVKVNKKPIWEKFFFDVILLAVAVYLIYNFNQNMETIQQSALQGQKMDPVLFLDAVLFIFALGLFILRLMQYLVKFVYWVGRNKWKPAMYASFLQITRTFSKQSGISVFLILTIALGLFYANIARTINTNSVERITYNTGADMVVSETWERKHLISGKQIEDYEFLEPDFLKYNTLLENGMCESITRVIYDDTAELKYNKSKVKDCLFQGIITNEFGNTATLKMDLNGEKHWYHYLNMLADNPKAVIISSNLAKELGVTVGQNVKLTRYCVATSMKEQPRGEMSGEVCAIVDHWPGYQKYEYEEGELKENYLVVANYSSSYRFYKVSPYNVWLNLADGVSVKEVEDVLEGMNLAYPTITSVEEQVQTMKESTLIQITNGMFTLSFIIALVLCVVGFMIYWIASIRQRELLFGVYRAMGMSVKEINRMLINEHIFSTLLSVIAGGGVGMIATVLFAELFGVIYLPQKHNIDIFLHFDAGDITKLVLVIALMMIICIVVLRKLIQSMNITQALKLGED